MPGHADPGASTCIPMAMGSLSYLLEGKVCALSQWHRGAGGVGAHEALLAKEKLPLGYFYFFDWLFVCFYEFCCFLYESVLGLNS